MGGTLTVTSAPGRYLVYNLGATKLQYMNGATELWSVADAGGVTTSSVSSTGTLALQPGGGATTIAGNLSQTGSHTITSAGGQAVDDGAQPARARGPRAD